MVEHPTADRIVPGLNPGAPFLNSGVYCMLILTVEIKIIDGT